MYILKKSSIFFITLLCMMVVYYYPVQAKNIVYQSNAYTYSLNDDGSATIVNWSGNINILIIPSYLDYHPVIALEEDAFYDEILLENIILPDSLISIGDGAFSHCKSLTSISLPDSLISIGDLTFSQCESLTSISLPDSLVSIGRRAFSNCNLLTSISLPDGLTTVGEGAFADCTSLKQFNVSSKNEVYAQIQGVLFNKITKTLHTYPSGRAATEYVVPTNILGIENDAFYGSKSLTSIRLPDSLISIGDSAFSGCQSLTSISLPDSLASIGDSVFWNCISLKQISLSNNLVSIGNYAFSRCESLTSISLPDSLVSIGMGAFDNCSSLKQINLPDNLTDIGYFAFLNCKSLLSISLPNSLCYIREETFSSCNSLTSINLPDNLVTIGELAFAGCNSLKSINFPNSLESIGNLAFANCDSLTNISLPNSLATIENRAFVGCDSLISISIPDSLVSIGDDAFSGCPNLTIMCGEDSTAVAYAIKAGIPYQYTSDTSWLDDASTNDDLRPIADTDTVSTEQNCIFSTSSSITKTLIPPKPPLLPLYLMSFDPDNLLSTASFMYEDSYFVQNAARENLNLADSSMVLSALAYQDDEATKALERLGFQDIWPVDYDRTPTSQDNDFIGLTIARKTVLIDGKKLELFAVVCRGSHDLEWLSNFNLGREESQEVHMGFGLASGRALCALKTYFSACQSAGVIDNDVSNNVVWVMGHSRGGAVTNLMAASLNREETIATKDKVFAYAFATPNVSRAKEEHRSGYENIRNYINPNDIITLVPLSSEGWGYWRYGIDAFMSSYINQQIGLRYGNYSKQKYQPFSDISREAVKAAVYSISPTWQDFYREHNPGNTKSKKLYTPSDVFNWLAYEQAGKHGAAEQPKFDWFFQGFAVSVDAGVEHLLSILTLEGNPMPEINDSHCVETYLLFLDILTDAQ